MPEQKQTSLTVTVPIERVERAILIIRGQKVLLDADLARLYGVTTRRLKEQVRRNIQRFPSDFVFELSSDEKAEVVANCDHLQNLKFSPARPLAFTEHGAIMAAAVLNSEQAVKVSVYVVRAFIKLRELLVSQEQLAGKLDELERKLQKHDGQILALIDAIRHLVAEPEPRRKPPIGFYTEGRKARRLAALQTAP